MSTPVRAATSGLVVPPGGGTRLALARSAPLVKFARRDGAERLAALESDLAPGGDSPIRTGMRTSTRSSTCWKEASTI